MSEWQNEKEILYPLGATPIEGGAKLLVCARAKTCRLLLYKKGEPDPVRIEEFKRRGAHRRYLADDASS